MRFDLKPMSFGELLDGTFKIYRGNFGLFFTIALVLNVPAVVISAWLRNAQQHVAPGTLPSGYGPALLVIVAISLVMWGAMVAAAVQVISGETTSLGKAISRLLGILRPTLMASFLFILLGSLFSLLLLIPGIIYFLGHALYLPVLLVEGGTGANALKRSKQLVKGIRGGRMDRVFGTSFLFGVLSWVLLLSVGMLIPAGLKATFAGAVVNQLPQAIVAPLLPIALVLIYYDARIRDEGYDLELRAKAAGTPAGTAAGTGAATTAGPA